MKSGQKGEAKVVLIVIICILVVALLILFGVIAWQIFHEDTTEPQYVQTQTNQIQNDTSGDELMVLEKLAKPFMYCTDPDCKINEEDHLHFGDKLAYDPTKLKEGALESSLSYTTLEINTGEGTGSVTFNAATTDPITEWYVIGEENGQLLLLAGNTTTTNLSLKGAKGVINSAYEMDKICAIYGNGAGAESASCLTLEKLNELTGVTANLETGTVTYKDGSSVEYLFNYGTSMKYSTSSRNQQQQVDPWTQQGQAIPTYITQYITSRSPLEVKSGYYGYLLSNTKIASTNERLARVNLALNKNMWLATIGMNAEESIVRYGPGGVSADNIVVSAIDLFSSDGTENIGSFPVRPIVRLSSNVNTGIVEKVME